jgi:hypothetical protein
MKLDKKYLYLFGFVLILFALLSNKIWFHDSSEYITVAKNLVGVDNVPIFSTHSILYPVFISLFLMIWPSLVMLKLVNVLIVFLIGLSLFYFYEDKKVFLIFSFSPIVWFMSIQTTPVLPATLAMTLSYIFFLKNNIRHNKKISGLLFGLACAFYTPLLIAGAVFLIVYFWTEEGRSLYVYLFFMFIGFIPRLLVDYLIFDNPIYTLIRYVGTNFIVSLGLNSSISGINIIPSVGTLLVFVAISPLLFKIYKINVKNNLRSLVFVGLTFLIYFIRTDGLKPYFIITPILIILLSKTFTNKDIVLHAFISILIIVLLTSGYFMDSHENDLKSDLNLIIKDYNPSFIVADKYNANNFASLLWYDEPKILWADDYGAYLNNRTILKSYVFELRPTIIELDKVLEFRADFNRFSNFSYEDYIYVAKRGSDVEIEILEIDKCYETLCVYTEKFDKNTLNKTSP